MKREIFSAAFLGLALVANFSPAAAQDQMPDDTGLATYHTAPRYRESESHPLRIVAYALHPIGWVAREIVFRPFSYFASSSETRRSIMGYREPFDYRRPECFSADDSTPDCRSLAPFNYDSSASDGGEAAVATDAERHVFFPDVNFDFNKRSLSELGRGRARQIAQLLNKEEGLKVVLEGHTDSVGGDDYNQKLGVDRAEALKAELVKLGINGDRLATVSFGESRQVFSENEAWAHAVNRRVETKADTVVASADVASSEDSGDWSTAAE